MQDDSRQAGTIEEFGGRGVWVPDGMSARDIMLAAKVLEDKWDVAPFTSREMVRDVLKAIAQGKLYGE